MRNSAELKKNTRNSFPCWTSSSHILLALGKSFEQVRVETYLPGRKIYYYYQMALFLSHTDQAVQVLALAADIVLCF